MKKWERYYEEYYCKVMVEKFLPQYSFEKSERPDWIDKKNNIGMECTIAQVDNNYSNSLKYADLVHNNCRNSKKRTDELNCFGEVTQWAYFQKFGDANPVQSMLSGLYDKIRKINQSNYIICNENWLTFYLVYPIYPPMFDNMLQELIMAQRDFKIKFDKILICDTTFFVVFNMSINKIDSFEIINQKSFAEKAKELAIEVLGEK